MKAIKNFEEFIKNGTVKKQSADRSRAEFLIKESENSYNNLQKKIRALGVSDETANDLVKSCYDILMELIRARMLINGLNASGFGAHEAEVSYMRTIGIDEKDVQFANQMRFFRNGMIYYGRSLDKEYADKVIEFTKRMRGIIK